MNYRYNTGLIQALAILVLLLGAAPRGTAAQPVLEGKLTAGDGVSDGYFGISASLYHNRALIGSAGGSAYIFERENGAWTEKTTLSASGGEIFDAFGYSVSLQDERALVGAFGDSDKGEQAGSAYIFELQNGSWTEVAKLTAGDGAEYNWFGYSVALNGNRAAVGALLDDDNGEYSGSVYIFEKENNAWVQKAKLVASDGAPEDFFGRSVSLHGNRVLVGAPMDMADVGNSGKAYIFELQNGVWTEAAKLTSSEGAVDEIFGTSVSLHGDRALIGAPWDDQNGFYTGSAYIFEWRNGVWTEAATLLAGDPEEEDDFGFAVSLFGDRALIGTTGYDASGGKVYVFESQNGVWTEVEKLSPPIAGVGDEEFGQSVSLFEDQALFGAWWDEDASNETTGAAYAYDLKLDTGTAISRMNDAPASHILMTNHPNPFDYSTTIRFDLPAAIPVRLVVYDMLGREVATLLDETRGAGPQEIPFRALDLPDGVYLYRLETPEHSYVRRMVLLRHGRQ